MNCSQRIKYFLYQRQYSESKKKLIKEKKRFLGKTILGRREFQFLQMKRDNNEIAKDIDETQILTNEEHSQFSKRRYWDFYYNLLYCIELSDFK